MEEVSITKQSGTPINQLTSPLPHKKDFNEFSKVTYLSPQSVTSMQQALRPASKNEKRTKNISFMLSPAGSELGNGAVEEGKSIKPEDDENIEYESWKTKFEKTIFNKRHTLARSTLKPKSLAVSPNPHSIETELESVAKKIDEKSKGLNNSLIPERPQTAMPTKVPSFQRLKQPAEDARRRKLDIINSNLRGLRNDKVIQTAKDEIQRVSREAAEEVDKIQFEKYISETL